MKFYEEALEARLEGIIVKSLTSSYSVGERTYAWLKLKPERDTIDCTIVKALFGKGRRAGPILIIRGCYSGPGEEKLFTIGKVSNLSEENMEALLKE